MSDSYVITLSAVVSTGALTQIYLPTCTPGPGTGLTGTQKRQPCEGIIYNAEVQTDGTNGGTIELWDLNGNDGGADVDTADQITNAQKNAAVAFDGGQTKLIYSQNFAGSGTARLAINVGTRFSKGLAARFVGAAGSCNLNVQVGGGFKKTWIAGL